MARNAGKVIGAEIVPQAVKNAKVNAKLNGISNVRFICADAGQAAAMLADEGNKPDVIVVDLPRKGIDQTTIDAIGKMTPDRLVYVSCDPATLSRDIKLLAEQGYNLNRYKVFDLFPRTSQSDFESLFCELYLTRSCNKEVMKALSNPYR